jgi:repressor LexA
MGAPSGEHYTQKQGEGQRPSPARRDRRRVPSLVTGRSSGKRSTRSSAAGAPIEAVATNETIAVPEDLVGKRETYVLRVKGDSMIDEQIRDGDFVVVEDRKTADNGEMVIALISGTDVTLKKFYRDNGRIRLQPANPAMQPLILDASQVQVQGVVVGVMRKY